MEKILIAGPKNVRKASAQLDEFCWLCHRRKSIVTCANCVRTFHDKCLKSIVHNAQSKECPECHSINAIETDNRNGSFDIQPLKFMMNEILQYPDNAILLDPIIEACLNSQSQLVNPISLTDIGQNIANGKYKSYRGFLADIKWINHNIHIIYKDNTIYKEIATRIVDRCKNCIENAEMCHECFMNECSHSNSFFTMVCAKPHLILWAKYSTFPHWPSKLMEVNGNVARVLFFGDHTYADVAIKDCMLYSLTNPMDATAPTNVQLHQAIWEANRYVMNLTEKFGNYVYANAKTPFDPSKLDEYLQTLTNGSSSTNISNSRPTGSEQISSKLDLNAMDKDIRESVQFDLKRNRVHDFSGGERVEKLPKKKNEEIWNEIVQFKNGSAQFEEYRTKIEATLKEKDAQLKTANLLNSVYAKKLIDENRKTTELEKKVSALEKQLKDIHDMRLKVLKIVKN